jgi:hypothetical protein
MNAFKSRLSVLWRHVLLWQDTNVSENLAASTSPWRWRQHESWKHWCPNITIHGVTTQKTSIWISTAVKTSNLAYETPHYVIFSIILSHPLLRSKYSSQRPVLKYGQSLFCSYVTRLSVKSIQTSRIGPIIFHVYLCLTKLHVLKAYWGSGDVAPRILWPRH